MVISLPRLAAVDRLPHLQVEHIERVRVLGIGEDVAVVPRPVDQVAIVGHERPGRAAVVGAIDARLGVLGLDDGPDPGTVGRRDRDTDLALQSVGQPLVRGDITPGVAAVGRLPELAARSTAAERPEVPVGFVDGGVENARVVGIHDQIDRAGLLAHEEHPLPTLTAVVGAIDTPFRVGAKGMAQRGHVDEVGVLGMDADLGDVIGVVQPHVAPALPAVGGFVNDRHRRRHRRARWPRRCRRRSRWDRMGQRPWRRSRHWSK